MQLEDYFDIIAPDDIRIRGHRIGLESILYEYIHRAQTPEEISQRFDTLTLEQIYAAILYYWHNKPAMDSYLARWLEHCRQSVDSQRKDAPQFAELINRLKAEATRQPA